MTGSLETVDDRPALRFERRLARPVERVWRAITEPDELARWFVAPVDWKPEAGEVFESFGETGEITELGAPHLIAWTYREERFRFELRPDGEGCVLVFTHVFEDRSTGADLASGWDVHLDRLDAHLAGGHLPVEELLGAAAERHERYARRFGLDPAVGRRTLARHGPLPLALDDGPVLRLEQRYDHPPERLWRAITEPGELRHWFPPGEAPEVTEREPPHLLAGSWSGDRLRFELRADDEGCVLVFTHVFAERDRAARDGAGWDRCFVRLAALLAGAPMSEGDSLRDWLEVHDRYAERFEVDPELGRSAIAGYQPHRRR